MHLSIDRKAVLGTALSFAFVFALCPMALAFPLSTSSASAESGQAGQAAASLVDTCRQYITEVGEEVAEQAEAAAAYAAIPESVHRAEAAIGTPYRSGASSPSGFDCSGLVSYCITGNYGHAYTSYSFWAMPAVADPQPGDVVACSPGHCGLYIGDGLMIHAPQSGEYVRVEGIRGKIVRP